MRWAAIGHDVADEDGDTGGCEGLREDAGYCGGETEERGYDDCGGEGAVADRTEQQPESGARG